MKKPNVLDFVDYRDFLNSYAKYKKSTSPNWSYGQWARELGLKSTSAITMILKKQRNMGASMAKKFVTYFSFSDKEKDFFEKLIKFEKASKGDKRLLLLMVEEMRDESEDDDNSQRSLFFNWRTHALREMSNLKDYQADPHWLKSRLDIDWSESQLAEHLERMQEAQILDQNLKATDKILSPDNRFSRKEPITYHEELMELSRRAVLMPFNQRALNGSTICVDESKLEEAKKLILDFQIRLSKLCESQSGDEVYQLSIQFFPLTKKAS